MFKVVTHGFNGARKSLLSAFSLLKASAEILLWDAAQEIRNEMQEPGKPIVYPVQWDSTKQRKAFFATNGFGRGIPTKRTGQGVNAWKAIKIQDGAQTSNPLAHIRHVSGFGQSRIHRGRWKVFNIVVAGVLRRLPPKVKNRLIVTFQREGFRVQ